MGVVTDLVTIYLGRYFSVKIVMEFRKKFHCIIVLDFKKKIHFRICYGLIVNAGRILQTVYGQLKNIYTTIFLFLMKYNNLDNIQKKIKKAENTQISGSTPSFTPNLGQLTEKKFTSNLECQCPRKKTKDPGQKGSDRLSNQEFRLSSNSSMDLEIFKEYDFNLKLYPKKKMLRY